MKRPLLLASALALFTGYAMAQSVAPAGNFMAQWDLDSDGAVTLAEAREQRDNIFSMFDSDGDGAYSAEELAGIDEHKLMELEAGMGPGHQRPEGMAPPPGRGAGNGAGKAGQGQGQGQGFFQPAAEGMQMFDANRDGTVTRAEFVSGTDPWFAMRDRTGDGVLTPADFGPPRG